MIFILTTTALNSLTYTRDNDTKYTVTIVDANGESGEYAYNTKITVTPIDKSDENLVFTHWERDGQIVSYDEEYSFYVNAATTVTAKYGETALEKIATITLSMIELTEESKLAYFSEYNVPGEVIENGILIHDKSDISVDEGYYTNKAVSKKTDNIGQYTIRKKLASDSEVWYAKAYVIYTDGENVYTLYSETVSNEN